MPYAGVVVRAYGESPANAEPVDVALRAVLVGNAVQIEFPVLLFASENAGCF